MEDTIIAAAIPKMDVLMEDFSNVQILIQYCARNKENLINTRNTWEVFFDGYDDDPREIPNIPEVVNWIEQSIEAGIPWFYFMNTNPMSQGLLVFLCCCCADEDPNYANRFIFDRERVLSFIDKNIRNLEQFANQYEIEEATCVAALDAVMDFIQKILSGVLYQDEPCQMIDRKKQIREAMDRLYDLEDLYGLNPNVKKYFAEGRLYYSYRTLGGYMGSIDTINYDERYADIVKDFEAQTSYLVYHVIEKENTIALLYVSNNYDQWMKERPTLGGVMAHVVNVESYESRKGYIKIDCLQGALYRINDLILPNRLDIDSGRQMSEFEEEIVERLEILKKIGLQTDLDIKKLYMEQREICCTTFQYVLGKPIGIVNRISAQSLANKILQLLSEQTDKQFYFVMDSLENELIFLYLSENPDEWEDEKRELENGTAFGIVVDTEKFVGMDKEINFIILNGGPIVI